jgi:uncharacterized membrane protein YphA (DoxX/SURF4 family)
VSDVAIGLPAWKPSIIRFLDETFDRRVDLRAIAVMRVLIGAVVIRHLWPDVRASVVPVERFHVPWWSWLPVPSPGSYRMLLWLGVVAGAAMVVGLAARAATVAAFAVVTYLVFVDMTAFAHNRGFLVWMLFGLALLPARGARSILHPTAAAGDAYGPWWPLLLMRIVVSSVYLTSGGTKLLNPDWRSGRVLWDRMARTQHLIPFDGALRDLVLSRAFHHVLSPAAIAVELFLGVGLWLHRTRLPAIWVALAFHVSIELTASVQTFSYTAIAALLLWVTPATRDRTLTADKRFAGVVRRLDWLGRFDITEAPATGSPARLIDRDGTTRSGRAARLTALSRLPLLFAVVAPALALDRIRERRKAARR